MNLFSVERFHERNNLNRKCTRQEDFGNHGENCHRLWDHIFMFGIDWNSDSGEGKWKIKKGRTAEEKQRQEKKAGLRKLCIWKKENRPLALILEHTEETKDFVLIVSGKCVETQLGIDIVIFCACKNCRERTKNELLERKVECFFH